MQDLKNDMDDLFRKAVERYPLKTCESRWDDISARINSKKRWVLFLPILFQHKKLPVSIFRGIAILIPIAIISLTPLIHKKTSTTILIKETGYSNISATISPKKSDQGSTPLQHSRFFCNESRKNISSEKIFRV